MHGATVEDALVRVKADGDALYDVPPDLINPEICGEALIATEGNGSFAAIPKHLLVPTGELLMAAGERGEAAVEYLFRESVIAGLADVAKSLLQQSEGLRGYARNQLASDWQDTVRHDEWCIVASLLREVDLGAAITPIKGATAVRSRL